MKEYKIIKHYENCIIDEITGLNVTALNVKQAEKILEVNGFEILESYEDTKTIYIKGYRKDKRR